MGFFSTREIIMRTLILIFQAVSVVFCFSMCNRPQSSYAETRAERVQRYEKMGKNIIENDIDSTIVFISGDTIYIDSLGIIRSFQLPSSLKCINLRFLMYDNNLKTLEFDWSSSDTKKEELKEYSVRALGRFGLEFSTTHKDEMYGDVSTIYYVYSYTKPEYIYFVPNRSEESSTSDLEAGFYSSKIYNCSVDGLLESNSNLFHELNDLDNFNDEEYKYRDCSVSTTINLNDGTYLVNYVEFNKKYYNEGNNKFSLSDYVQWAENKLRKELEEKEEAFRKKVLADAISIKDISRNPIKYEQYKGTTKFFELELSEVLKSDDPSKGKYVIIFKGAIGYAYTNDENFIQLLKYPCGVIVAARLIHLKEYAYDDIILNNCELLYY